MCSPKPRAGMFSFFANRWTRHDVQIEASRANFQDLDSSESELETRKAMRIRPVNFRHCTPVLCRGSRRVEAPSDEKLRKASSFASPNRPKDTDGSWKCQPQIFAPIWKHFENAYAPIKGIKSTTLSAPWARGRDQASRGVLRYGDLSWRGYSWGRLSR